MTRQWLRKIKLTIEGSGKQIDVSELRIRFTVQQELQRQRLAIADITISNLSDDTANTINREGKMVSLEAGYEDGFGLIHKGEIFQKRGNARETPVDKYLKLTSRSGDTAYSFSTVNKTLAAGHTFRDQVDVALAALKPYGVTAGFIADLGSQKMPRGRALFGMTRDLLRTVGQSTNSAWTIRDQKLEIVKNDKAMDGQAFVINSQTGMVGMPVQTIGGIQVRMLLNSKVRPGTRLKIDQKSIQQAALDPGFTSGAIQQNFQLPSVAADGFYKVLYVEHSGDSRGTAWYTDCACVAVSEQGLVLSNFAKQGIPTDV
ncbi:phage protein [Bosea vaviloviae]|uniref:Bacteriophage protein n=1 Tax=Bosea vaviloviae TaxID=1526658 RepID=A0A0N1F2B6_9HYPH|nr:hypothetical protein [Bosea vaviloviae]KPH79313.1 hypothetical protein AE618_18580 [Bosea vaviloviae]